MSDKNTKKIILIDMDDTLCEFTLGFYNELKKRDIPQDIKNIDPGKRLFYHLAKNYPKEYLNLIEEILSKKGFIETLKPVKGSIDAVKQLMKHYNIFFCSSPLKCSLSRSSEEKHKWIQKYFNTSENLILTTDKTIIQGDYLIDDKFPIIGQIEPTWEQIIYERSHNYEIIQKLIKVSSWDDILKLLL